MSLPAFVATGLKAPRTHFELSGRTIAKCRKPKDSITEHFDPFKNFLSGRNQHSTKFHAIYTHAEWQKIVDATARLSAAIRENELSAWLSALTCGAEISD